MKNGFLCFIDEDGEKNYLPLINIVCIDVKRDLIYNDEMWNEIQKEKELGNRKN